MHTFQNDTVLKKPIGALLRLCNDVGWLSEEYHPRRCRLPGNFPQTRSHLSLIKTAHQIERTAQSNPG